MKLFLKYVFLKQFTLQQLNVSTPRTLFTVLFFMLIYSLYCITISYTVLYCNYYHANSLSHNYYSFVLAMLSPSPDLAGRGCCPPFGVWRKRSLVLLELGLGYGLCLAYYFSNQVSETKQSNSNKSTAVVLKCGMDGSRATSVRGATKEQRALDPRALGSRQHHLWEPSFWDSVSHL